MADQRYGNVRPDRRLPNLMHKLWGHTSHTRTPYQRPKTEHRYPYLALITHAQPSAYAMEITDVETARLFLSAPTHEDLSQHAAYAWP